LQLKRSMEILLYCWWNIWKERSKRIFDSVYKNELQVALSTKEDIELYLSESNHMPTSVDFWEGN
jgi:hypothetical protein